MINQEKERKDECMSNEPKQNKNAGKNEMKRKWNENEM